MPDCWIGSFGITDCICQQLNSLAAGQLSCNWCSACSWRYAFCQQIVILAFIDMEKEYHCDSKSSIFSTGIHLCWHVSYVNIFLGHQSQSYFSWSPEHTVFCFLFSLCLQSSFSCCLSSYILKNKKKKVLLFVLFLYLSTHGISQLGTWAVMHIILLPFFCLVHLFQFDILICFWFLCLYSFCIIFWDLSGVFQVYLNLPTRMWCLQSPLTLSLCCQPW